MDQANLKSQLETLQKDYDLVAANRMSLDLSRGKPAAAQLDLSNGLEDALQGNFLSRDGVDVRNYGGLRGLPEARELGAQDDLINIEGLTPQMVLALAKDDVLDLATFATCADWELAGGYTIIDGKRVKDEGVLEPFDVSLEEAQFLIMKARIELGIVDPNEILAEAEAAEAEAEGEDGEAAEAELAEEQPTT